jgi:hypothetical protein
MFNYLKDHIVICTYDLCPELQADRRCNSCNKAASIYLDYTSIEI